jgi:hypothetical protein
MGNFNMLNPQKIRSWGGMKHGTEGGHGQGSHLLDQVRLRLRVKHQSLGAEQSYLHWIKRFILIARQAASLRHRRAGGRAA